MTDSLSSLDSSIIVVVALVVILVCLIPGIMFLLSLQKALNRCAPESRTMSPGQVWLLLIPLFSLIWIFMVVNRIAESLRKEFTRRQLPLAEPEPGKKIGMIMAILFIVSVIPLVNMLAGPAGLICWILYWVKISGYSKQLAAPAAA